MTKSYEDELDANEVGWLEAYEGAQGPSTDQTERMLAKIRSSLGEDEAATAIASSDHDDAAADDQAAGVELSATEIALLEVYRDALGPRPEQIARMYAAVDAAASDPVEGPAITQVGGRRRGLAAFGAGLMAVGAFAAGVALTLRVEPTPGRDVGRSGSVAWNANAAAEAAALDQGLVASGFCVGRSPDGGVERILVPIGMSSGDGARGGDGDGDSGLPAGTDQDQPIASGSGEAGSGSEARALGEGVAPGGTAKGAGRSVGRGLGVLGTVPGTAGSAGDGSLGAGSGRHPGRGLGTSAGGAGAPDRPAALEGGDQNSPASLDDDEPNPDGEDQADGDQDGESEEDSFECESDHMACQESAQYACEQNPEGCAHYFDFCDMNLETCLGSGPGPEPDPELEQCELDLEECVVHADEICQQDVDSCDAAFTACENQYSACTGIDFP